MAVAGNCVSPGQGAATCSKGCGDCRVTTTNSAHEVETMRVPADLRWAVAKMVEMCDAGWEPCGFTGGGSGKVQFQKVEFRRRRDAD